jgi:hypothetical protein
MTEEVVKEKRKLKHEGQWKKGQSGNPNGRPKGSKTKITEKFLVDLHNSWEKRGVAALEKLYQKDVSTYVRVVASMVPKDYTINEGEGSIERIIEQLSDQELADAIASLSTAGASIAKGADKETVTDGFSTIQ